jgi:hypothetical protein
MTAQDQKASSSALVTSVTSPVAVFSITTRSVPSPGLPAFLPPAAWLLLQPGEDGLDLLKLGAAPLPCGLGHHGEPGNRRDDLLSGRVVQWTGPHLSGATGRLGPAGRARPAP